jgi:hypothetical protein
MYSAQREPVKEANGPNAFRAKMPQTASVAAFAFVSRLAAGTLRAFNRTVAALQETPGGLLAALQLPIDRTDPAPAVRYMALPDFDWPRLRREFPEDFENPVTASIA